MGRNYLLVSKPCVAFSANTSWYLFNFRRGTIIEFIEQGYTVVVIAPKDIYTEKLQDLGCEYIEIKISRNVDFFSDIRTVSEYFKIIRKLRPLSVFNFTPKVCIYSTLACALDGYYVVNNISGMGRGFVRKNFVYFIIRSLFRLSSNFTNVYFFQNKFDREYFQSNIIRKDIPLFLIPGSGVDLKRFSHRPLPESGPTRYLLCARLIKEKGVYLFVEAARYMKKKYGENVEFVIVGFLESGNDSCVSSTEIKKWESEGILNYFGVSDQIEMIMESVHCVVLPSFYREGVPKSLIEACAVGRAIITTNNIGCRDVVENNVNGYLCEPKNQASLIEKLEKFYLLSYEDKVSFGNAGRNKAVKEFDERIVIEAYNSVLRDAAKFRGGE